MLQQAMEEINMEPGIRLKSLGLALAGSEREKAKQQLNKLMIGKCDLIESVEPCTDAQCALSMVSKSGAGMLLISGTGSCCQMINPDGVTRQCGGWGNILGDEGSACDVFATLDDTITFWEVLRYNTFIVIAAYWISYKAIKIMLDHEDGLVKSPYDITYIKEAINIYFEMDDKTSLMEIFYTKSDIRKVAGFCVEVGKGATEMKDMLCLYLFNEAGRYLAKHITAQLPSVNEKMFSAPGGLQVVCVGSVFKSWDLLQKGFEEVLQEYNTKENLKEISLLRLTQSVAIGAAFHGARTVDRILPIEYSKNASVFRHLKF